MQIIKALILIAVSIMLQGCILRPKSLPKGFVYLNDVDATIIENLRYHTVQNFIGRVIDGYESDRTVCTNTAAQQLKQAHDYFKSHGYRLVVYDAYRPQTAVDQFGKWGMNDEDDVARKYYYPTLAKKDLFRLRYIGGEKSTHSRGSTFDLTLIEANKELKPIAYSERILPSGDKIPFLDDNTVDMGSSFDLFHEASHHNSILISPSQLARRNFLRMGMKQHGFNDYKEEWWHYTLADELYPDTYFDFVVSK